MPPDLWLPEEGSATGLQWAIAADAAGNNDGAIGDGRWATQTGPAASNQRYTGAAPDDGGLEQVLEAVYHAGAARVSTSEHFSTAEPAERADAVLWEQRAALHLSSPHRQHAGAPGKASVPAPEPITLPPWGSRAAANPPPRQPQPGVILPGDRPNGHFTLGTHWGSSSTPNGITFQCPQQKLDPLNCLSLQMLGC